MSIEIMDVVAVTADGRRTTADVSYYCDGMVKSVRIEFEGLVAVAHPNTAESAKVAHHPEVLEEVREVVKYHRDLLRDMN